MAGVADAAMGNAAGWAQVADIIAQTQEREAHGEDFRVLAKQRLQNLLQQQDKIAKEQQAAQLEANTPPPGGGVVAAEAPKNPIDMLQAQINTETQNYARAKQMSQIYKSNGIFDKAKDADIDAGKIQTNLVSAQQALRRQQLEDLRETGGIASGINDETTFNLGFPMLLAKNPRLAKAPLDRDPDTQQPVWGPKTAATMKGLGEFSRTSEQKTTDEIKLANAAIAQQNADTKLQTAQTNAALADVRAALVQARADFVAGPLSNKVQAQADKALSPASVKQATTKALRPATATSVNAAADIAATEFELSDNKKFPDLKTFATDVANVANRIVASDAAHGDITDYADAYSQAIALLKPYTKDDVKKGFFNDSTVVKYTRPSKLPSSNPDEDAKAGDADAVLMKKLVDAKINGSVSKGKVVGPEGSKVVITSKEQMKALPSGTPFVDAKGNPWIAP